VGSKSKAEATVRVSPDVVFQQIGAEAIIINLQTDRIFSLNRTGTRLWELLVAGVNLTEAKQQMVQEYDVDPDQLASEVENVLQLMLNEGLILDDEARDDPS
jgi:hypothetical protein